MLGWVKKGTRNRKVKYLFSFNYILLYVLRLTNIDVILVEHKIFWFILCVLYKIKLSTQPLKLKFAKTSPIIYKKKIIYSKK